ncbi:50S ribosomal protein L21 [Candidatus Aerophobetes bacterium]|uniref:Large ribosomal subunit protein bL21 n=1 Tax=Aerophobetes bacterium TaxID=2030807 RepID=A0A2A4YM09_UNCAE|nr:MAG: 50S ribosomal protein L21 [Candidatus Aerophobetes bacterium]
MYAIIETGGNQFKVEKDDVIDVELLHGVDEDCSGKKIEFDSVLLVSDGKATKVGSPKVDSAKVLGEILGLAKGPKKICYKYKKRKNFRRKVGHRQKYSRVKIVDIVSN